MSAKHAAPEGLDKVVERLTAATERIAKDIEHQIQQLDARIQNYMDEGKREVEHLAERLEAVRHPAQPAKRAAAKKPAAKKATAKKPAAKKPAAKKATARKSGAAKPATTRPAAKRAATARTRSAS